MTLTQMQYVITLAKCLSFTEASRLLYITQPTLSKQISIIEEEIGFRIFYRGKKSTTLTKAGSRFCQGLENIIEAYENNLNVARQIDRAEVGALRVGVSEYRAVRGRALYAIRQMKEKGYDVEIVARNLPSLEWMLAKGDVDLIIRPVQDNLAAPSNSNEQFLYMINNCLVVPSDYPMPTGRAPQLRDFAGEDILMVGEQMPAFEQSVRESFACIGVTPHLKRVEQFSDLVVMLASRLGISVLPEEHFLAGFPEVKFLYLPEITPSRIHAVWRKGAVNPAINVFSQLAEACPPEFV